MMIESHDCRASKKWLLTKKARGKEKKKKRKWRMLVIQKLGWK